MKVGHVLIGIGVLCNSGHAQKPASVSLEKAQQIALRNHPRIASASLTADATRAVVKETRSAFYPVLSGNVTGVGAEHDATISAGAVTTSSVYSRLSSGIVASQLLTDFGRTASLEKSANLRSQSQDQNVASTRAQVLVEVKQTYYQALAADSVLKAVQASLDLRKLTLRQVTTLAQSALRSTLDVSFAQVNVSQAELDLLRAQNHRKAAHARLSAAMGYDRDQPFSLIDESLPAPLNPDADALIAEALHDRPDLAALRLNRDALTRNAEAEKQLRNPTLTAAAVAGIAPVHDERIQGTYSAAGVNLNVPVLNGGLFKARREEAESRAAAAEKDTQALSVQIARDVRVAWLDANDSFERLDLTARIVAEAKEALRLAQARYDNALGGIVELSTAQLNETSAEIAGASAKYEYLNRRAVLDFEIGSLR
jgi:outer membrane protein